MKYLKYYYDKSRSTRNRYEVGDEALSYDDAEDFGKVFECTHDIALNLMNEYEWFEESFSGESHEIAIFIGEQMQARAQYCEWKPRIGHWYAYTRRRTPQLIAYYRYYYEKPIDFSKYSNDPDLDETIKRVSGLKDLTHPYFNLIEESSTKRKVNVLNLVDYVMINECIYKEITVQFKYLRLSMMLSIIRFRTILYPKLSDNYLNQLKYLLNCYYKLYKQFELNEVILVDN